MWTLKMTKKVTCRPTLCCYYSPHNVLHHHHHHFFFSQLLPNFISFSRLPRASRPGFANSWHRRPQGGGGGKGPKKKGRDKKMGDLFQGSIFLFQETCSVIVKNHYLSFVRRGLFSVNPWTFSMCTCSSFFFFFPSFPICLRICPHVTGTRWRVA